MPDPTTCPFCLTSRSMSVRWDCKARPFLSCALCRHRIFCATGLAFANIVLLLRGLDNVAPAMRLQSPALLSKMYGTDRPDLAAIAVPYRENIRELPSMTSSVVGAA